VGPAEAMVGRVSQREESDQLPEEGPSGQVPEDDEPGDTRDEAEDSAGVPGEDAQDDDGQASGNPQGAG
jgi:hypothetical protein